MVEVPPIRCARFELVSLSLAGIEALLLGDVTPAARELDVRFPAGAWLADASQVLKFRRDDLLREPSIRPWILRWIVLPERTVAGYAGFHAPPDSEGRCELGYTIFETFRRRGIASEAAQCLMRWAREEHGVRTFRVSIAPDNEPSLAMASRLGFVRTGEQIDEVDGLEYVFELTVS
jgi:RimJ/RimL family protein N-acetyltransferase